MNRVAPLALIAAVSASAAPAATVTFDWVPIGDPGVPHDGVPSVSVDHPFLISKHEVTNAQYAVFLNSIDPTGVNPAGAYNANMAGDFGGIVNTGAADGARYAAKPGREDQPVNYVSFVDAMRFVNWLHNGQVGGFTDQGAYSVSVGRDETRSADARYWIPNELEWYKAAYYDPVAGVYYDYPTGSDAPPFSDAPPGPDAPDSGNVANFFHDDGAANGYDDGFAVTGSPLFDFPQGVSPLTDVGAYSLTTSPYGVSDMGGNVSEWTESLGGASTRIVRGGSWEGVLSQLRSSSRSPNSPSSENRSTGFRVATLPEPTAALLLGWAALAGAARRRRT